MSPASSPSSGYEIAAGGLVWTPRQPARLAVVRRAAHRDWTLPKGRPEPGEMIADTALREAQEETGRQLRRAEFLGAYAYLKGETPKVVLLWRMIDLELAYAHPAPADEVAEVQWLDATAVITRLTHSAERAFVTQFSS